MIEHYLNIILAAIAGAIAGYIFRERSESRRLRKPEEEPPDPMQETTLPRSEPEEPPPAKLAIMEFRLKKGEARSLMTRAVILEVLEKEAEAVKIISFAKDNLKPLAEFFRGEGFDVRQTVLPLSDESRLIIKPKLPPGPPPKPIPSPVRIMKEDDETGGRK